MSVAQMVKKIEKKVEDGFDVPFFFDAWKDIEEAIDVSGTGTTSEKPKAGMCYFKVLKVH